MDLAPQLVIIGSMPCWCMFGSLLLVALVPKLVSSMQFLGPGVENPGDENSGDENLVGEVSR